MSASTVSSRPTQRRPVERRNAAVPTRRVTPRPRPRVRSVPQPASARRAPFLILVVSLLGAGLLGMLALNTALAQGSFRVSDLQRQVAALDDQQQALQQRAAVLAAPQRLARRAGALGMVPMELPAFLRASDGKVLGRPQPASGAGTTATAGTSSTTSSSTGGPATTGTQPAGPSTTTGLGPGVTAPGTSSSGTGAGTGTGAGPARQPGGTGTTPHTQHGTGDGGPRTTTGNG